MILMAVQKVEKVTGWLRVDQVKLLASTGGYEPQIAAHVGVKGTLLPPADKTK